MDAQVVDLHGYVRDIAVGETFAARLGFRLKMARLGMGLSQGQVERSLGLTRGVVSRYERGCRQPDVQTLAALARLLRVDVGILLE